MKTVQVERRQRGVFGWIFSILFWTFNILMLLWAIASGSLVGDVFSNAHDGAEKAGAALGAGIGFAFLFFVWALGDVILGMLMFFTQGRKIIETISQ